MIPPATLKSETVIPRKRKRAAPPSAKPTPPTQAVARACQTTRRRLASSIFPTIETKKGRTPSGSTATKRATKARANRRKKSLTKKSYRLQGEERDADRGGKERDR